MDAIFLATWQPAKGTTMLRQDQRAIADGRMNAVFTCEHGTEHQALPPSNGQGARFLAVLPLTASGLLTPSSSDVCSWHLADISGRLGAPLSWVKGHPTPAPTFAYAPKQTWRARISDVLLTLRSNSSQIRRPREENRESRSPRRRR